MADEEEIQLLEVEQNKKLETATKAVKKRAAKTSKPSPGTIVNLNFAGEKFDFVLPDEDTLYMIQISMETNISGMGHISDFLDMTMKSAEEDKPRFLKAWRAATLDHFQKLKEWKAKKKGERPLPMDKYDKFLFASVVEALTKAVSDPK